jgi:pyrroline-5-carboxylate reductase
MAYGVIGVGAIGAAIVTGLCENVDDAPKILVSPRNAGITAALAQRFATVDVAADNQAVVDGAPVVIVCVRPHVAQTVLAELRFPADRIVISAIAGVPVPTLRRLVAPATDVARVSRSRRQRGATALRRSIRPTPRPRRCSIVWARRSSLPTSRPSKRSPPRRRRSPRTSLI